MSRRWAPALAALSVVVVAVGVALVVGRSGGTSRPPVLRLAAGAGVVPATAATADAKVRASGDYVLTGTLPTGPDSAPASMLSRRAAPLADVRRLLRALGIADEPRRIESGWQAGTLRVDDSAGNPWSIYAGCGPDAVVSSDGATVGCGIASTGVVTAPGAVSGSGGGSSSSGVSTPAPIDLPSPGPTADVTAARVVAARVLSALGLADADIDVQPGGERVYVTADPHVGGMRTVGWSTTLEIDANGAVVGGSGHLGVPERSPSYPIVGARTAFDALPVPPRPMMLCPQPGCPSPTPMKVTGAELGLQFTPLAQDEAALLPAWLFTVDGWSAPLAQIAVEPAYLSHATPPVASDEPAPNPGAVEPAPAVVPPATKPATGR